MKVHVSFEVTPEFIARAVADHSREVTDEHDEQVAYARSVTKTQAIAHLRNGFRWYGALCWPDDFPMEPYRVALDRARLWFPDVVPERPVGRSVPLHEIPVATQPSDSGGAS